LDIQIAQRSRAKHGIPPREAPMLQYFESRGHRAEFLAGHQLENLRDGVLLVMGNMIWYPELLQKLKQTSPSQRPFVVLWHSEPLPPPRAAGLPLPWLSLREVLKIALRDRRVTDVYSNYWMLRSLHRQDLVDRLVVSTRGRQDFLAERGIASDWIPLCYGPERGHPMALERDIDVLFLGMMDVPRRQKIIQRFEARGLRVMVKGEWGDPSCWGDARTELLNRTRILLNFPRTAGEMSGMRFFLGISNLALVVSEPIYRPDPYIPGEHFVSTSLEDMPEVVQHYLQNEAERVAITTAAWQHVQKNVNLDYAGGRLLELMEQSEK